MYGLQRFENHGFEQAINISEDFNEHIFFSK
jgi:hypothetical protein